jgi:hypothetical protein
MLWTKARDSRERRSGHSGKPAPAGFLQRAVRIHRRDRYDGHRLRQRDEVSFQSAREQGADRRAGYCFNGRLAESAASSVEPSAERLEQFVDIRQVVVDRGRDADPVRIDSNVDAGSLEP